MSDYALIRVSPGDTRTLAQIDALLAEEGLTRDRNLDCVCAMVDGEGRVIATGSSFGRTLRCFAVSRDHQGEGLLNQVVSQLMELQIARGNSHLFLYTKTKTVKFFQSLGFYEIARVDGVLSFLENRRQGFPRYLQSLTPSPRPGVNGAIVMNANPFTLGHRYLVETAAARCDTLHLFLLSEDASLVPFAVRRQLVEAGIRDIPNVILHESGPYIISSATFPSYFLRDADAVIDGHARLDLAVFSHIARALDIGVRFVGEEPTSHVTGQYNAIMARCLPEMGIECRILPRLRAGDRVISASTVRQALRQDDWPTLEAMLPPTTLDYFRSEASKPVREAIARAADVEHY